MKAELAALITEALEKLVTEGVLEAIPDAPPQIDRPKDSSHGDLSCNIAMVLAKPSTFGVMLPIHRISVVICSRGVILKVSTVSHPLPYIILHPFMIATLNHMSQFVFTSTKVISSVPCH